MMGFELESDTGSRFMTSRRHSPSAVPVQHNKSQNNFLFIGTDPPCYGGHQSSSKLDTLPVGKLIPISVGPAERSKNSAVSNNITTQHHSTLANRPLHGSKSAPAGSRNRSGQSMANCCQAASKGMDYLKPAEKDLQQEQLLLSSMEKMTDVKHHTKHLLRLHRAAKVIIAIFEFNKNV